MAFPKYQTKELLNKILNSAETAIQVDIVAGAEYAEDAAHTSADTGNFVLGVRNDTLAALGGTDGDYVPFQMNSDGALYVAISALPGSTDTIEVVGDAAENAAVAGNPVLIGGRYDSSGRTLGDGDVGAIALDADGAVHIADGGNTITVDGTVTANLSSTDNTVLDNILTKNTEIDAVLDTIDADTGAIKTAVEIIDNAISGSEMQVDVVASLPAGSNTIGVVDLGSTDNAVLDAMVVDLAEIEVATEASQAALEKMLYGTALAVTAVHGGSDHSLGATYEAFFIGVGGDVSLDCATSGSNIVFKNLASGQLLPVRATVVNATNTTATNIVALKA